MGFRYSSVVLHQLRFGDAPVSQPSPAPPPAAAVCNCFAAALSKAGEGVPMTDGGVVMLAAEEGGEAQPYLVRFGGRPGEQREEKAAANRPLSTASASRSPP